MVDRLEVDLIVKAMAEGFGDVSKDVEGIGESFEVTEESAKKLLKQFGDLGVNTDEMSENFLKLNPEVKQSIDLLEELGISADGGGDAIKTFEQKEKDAEKQSKKLSTQLKGLVKGFIGIGTAIAAGRALAKFAKDALDAAAAAGVLPAAFKEAEKASDRLKLAAGENLGNALEGTVSVMTRMKDSTASNLEIQNRLSAAVRNGLITSKERGFLISELNKGMRSQVDVVGELIKIEGDHNREGLTGLEILSQRVAEEQRLADLRSATAAEAGITAGTGAEIEELIPGLIAGDFQVPVEIVPFFEGLDLNISSQIQTAMAQIDFEEAGGRELVADFQEILEGLNVGEISQTLADQLFAEMFVQAEQIKVAMGEITADEAARNIAKTLGVAFQDALNLVLNIEQTLLNIDGLKVRAQILIKIKQTGGTTIPGVNLAQVLGGQVAKKGRAAGGPVGAGELVRVGELGPELFRPNTAGTVIPNNELGGNNSALEAEIAGMRSDLRNVFADFTQAIAEALG